MRSFVGFLAPGVLGLVGCSAPGTAVSGGPDAGVTTGLVDSRSAAQRLASHRSRFVVRAAEPREREHAGAIVEVAHPVIGEGLARFELDGDRLRSLLPEIAKQGVRHTATVRLPRRAAGHFELEDDTTKLSIRATLSGTSDAGVQTDGGLALYPGALTGADVIHRVRAEGTEDFVVFDAKPAREELVYRVDVSRVAGLRLVSNVMEFLDASGTPRLRIASPYVVDVGGSRREARLSIEGCAYDRDARAPWGRGVTAAGAESCVVRVTWAGVAYPAIVDPAWSTTGALVSARSRHTASALASGKVLLAGGFYASGASNSAELYDPASGTFSPAGSMSNARGSHTASVLTSGKVLLAGGSGNVGLLASAELYDPASGTFSMAGALSIARELHTASALPSGKVLLAGGEATSGILASAELYDPSTSTFSSAGSMVNARMKHTASVLTSGKVLLAGGYGPSGAPIELAELYDPSAHAFSATGSMAIARVGHTASLLSSGKLLVAGGEGAGGVLASAELFNPTSGTFSPAGSMTRARCEHTSSVLASGKILVAGGRDVFGSSYTSAELYDPASSAFSLAGTLVGGRALHTATVLTSGKLLVAAGGGMAGNQLASAELFAQQDKGAGCTTAGECLSGFCAIDGVCCDSECRGTCQVCAAAHGASANGTCTTAPLGFVGTPPCLNYRCDGTHTTCGTCVTDAACAPGYWCDAGNCAPQGYLGTACTTGGHECASNYCVDGFCCDAACTGSCEACDVPGAAGTCVAVAGAPRGARPACGGSGVCAGACGGGVRDSCLFPGGATTCSPAACADATHTSAPATCDGAGACSAPLVADCGAYVCDPATSKCKTTCHGGSDCATSLGFGCTSGACQKGGRGSSCGSAGECDSGFCVDAVCCSTATCATYERCNVEGSLGVCSKPLGAACADGAECGSGICADGVCCNAPCTGQCEACDVSGNVGRCGPVSSAPHGGRPPCVGSDPQCKGSCDGQNTATCKYAAAECAATCSSDAESISTCDTTGACVAPPTPTGCNGFSCAADGHCEKSCSASSDCASGFLCDTKSGRGVCVPANPTCSDDGTTLVGPDGSTKPCAPFKCLSGACVAYCTDSTHCQTGYRCDAAGVCTAIHDEPATEEPGGCSVGARGESALAGAGLLALVGLARRRRTPARPAPPPGR